MSKDQRSDGRPEEAQRGRRLETGALGVLYAFTLIAVAGYGVYGRHPELLPPSDFALRVFSASFHLFARLHIVVAAAALGAILVRALGLRWLPALVAVYVVSFSAEHIGTGWGVPFGGYAYTGLLGPKLGGRVPMLIPLSWFLMAVPSWVLAHRAVPGRGMRFRRIVLGALWLVAWDLALDPAMSFLTPYWVWEETGPYYGMPWLNLAGWLATGLALMTTLEAFAGRVAWARLDGRTMRAYYAAVVAMPLGMVIAAGAWMSVGATLAAMAACSAIGWALGSSVASGRSPAMALSPAAFVGRDDPVDATGALEA